MLYMVLAKKVAIRSPLRCKHGAVIVNPKLGIVSTGFNRPDFSLKQSDMCHREFALHAESDAMRKIPRGILRGSDVYVARVTKLKGYARLSRPCKKCMHMLRIFNIKNVYYLTNSDTIEKIIL